MYFIDIGAFFTSILRHSLYLNLMLEFDSIKSSPCKKYTLLSIHKVVDNVDLLNKILFSGKP